MTKPSIWSSEIDPHVLEDDGPDLCTDECPSCGHRHGTVGCECEECDCVNVTKGDDPNVPRPD